MTDSSQQPASQPSAPQTFAGATRAQVSDWRAEYGEDRMKLQSVPTSGGERQQFIIRAPSRAEYNRYLSEVAKSDRSYDRVSTSTRNLFMACLLAPDQATIRDVWDRFPALTDKMAEPLMTLAGADAEVREETF